jgi:hypothetical protein
MFERIKLGMLWQRHGLYMGSTCSVSICSAHVGRYVVGMCMHACIQVPIYITVHYLGIHDDLFSQCIEQGKKIK